MNGLQDKVILVCGGAAGIGAATVRRLSGEGVRVAIGDLNLTAAEDLAQELADAGGQARAWQFDQGDEASVKALVADSIAHFGRLDGLLANVADLKTVLVDGDILSNEPDIWERTLRVNVTGTASLIRAVLPQMLEQGSGSIVCTSSSASVVGEAERPAYAASKAGVEAICRHVASKWGKQGIRCNAIAPGLIMTEQLEANLPQETKDWVLKGLNSPRHGLPMDIASAVAFLLSDDGAWVNGQAWHVNGGVHYGH